MHICFICREYPPSLRGGGIASYIKDISHGLHDAGHRVTVIAASDDTNLSSDEEDDGVRVIRLSGGDFFIPEVEKGNKMYKFRALTRFYSYRKKIKNAILSLHNIDVIEVAEYGAENLFLKDIDIPVVIRLHCPSLIDLNDRSVKKLSFKNALYYWQGLQEVKMLKQSKYITSCSKHLKEWVVQNFFVSKDVIKVIYNAIQINKWNFPLINKEKSKLFTILSVGTICETKGSKDLIDACAIIAQRHKDFKFQLCLVGKTGSYASYLKEKYGQYTWLKIVGVLPREEVMKLYSEANIVCLPSWWENMPMACIEAMLNGSIVIGSKSGGMSEIIEDGVSGFLVQPKRSVELSDCLWRVINIPDNEKQFVSKNAKRRICETFSMDVIVEQMVDYYNFVIADFKKNKK